MILKKTDRLGVTFIRSHSGRWNSTLFYVKNISRPTFTSVASANSLKSSTASLFNRPAKLLYLKSTVQDVS